MQVLVVAPPGQRTGSGAVAVLGDLMVVPMMLLIGPLAGQSGGEEKQGVEAPRLLERRDPARHRHERSLAQR